MHNLLPSSISMVITETLKNLHLQLLRAPSKSHQKVNIKATKIFKPSSRVSGRVEVVDHQKKKRRRGRYVLLHLKWSAVCACLLFHNGIAAQFVRQTQLTRFLLHINTAICIRY